MGKRKKEKKKKKKIKRGRGQTVSCGAFMRPGNGLINP
jgi:hypothetical protein